MDPSKKNPGRRPPVKSSSNSRSDSPSTATKPPRAQGAGAGHSVPARAQRPSKYVDDQEREQDANNIEGGDDADEDSCAAGHVLCSTCFEGLLDKNNCQQCFGATSYDRCLAIERILESIQIPCSNAGHGCMAKMAYHEMEEHEKKCTHKLSSNAVQPMFQDHGLPMVSPSTTININVNIIHEKAEHDNRTCPANGARGSSSSVVKMGPCGGGGDDAAWEMDVRGMNRIIEVVVHHEDAVNAISVLYERDGQEEQSKLWGAVFGKRSEICLEKDEYLTSVKGRYGHFNGWSMIRALTFVSNRRTFGPYGKDKGMEFELPAVGGGKIIGFHGRSGGLIDAIGTYVKLC